MRPLEGIRVVDFSTLLPGPLATLILAEAGAEVIKIERPGGGDEMRGYPPPMGPAGGAGEAGDGAAPGEGERPGAAFALLNRGKRSVTLDLKDAGDLASARELIAGADVLVEQFRPGVMDRLGLGYAALRADNPGLVYCALTGYGQSGPRAGAAAHDLNYIAETGLLALAGDHDGAPVVPPALVADIAGGAYPAAMNILLALQARQHTSEGCYLDVAMCDNLFPLMFWALGSGFATGRWPGPGEGLLAGGSPRYQVYRTADGRYLAAAPLEERFWQRFCTLIDLPAELRHDDRDREATRAGVAGIIAAKPAAHWRALFEGEDVCCTVVATLAEALDDPQVRARDPFARVVTAGGGRIPALPVPVAGMFRADAAEAPAPALGEANGELARPADEDPAQ